MGMNLTCLIQDNVSCQAVMESIMKYRVPRQAGNFLSRRITVSFLGMILLMELANNYLFKCFNL